MKLNQKLVDAIGAKPDRVIWDDDAPGLGLRVQSGKRTWIVRYRVARSQRQKSASGDLSLKLRRGRSRRAS
jgi:Arm DNA-binding domain